MADAYQFAVALERPDGSAIGQELVSPDWEPAVEEARFALLRAQGVWLPETDVADIEPIWHPTAGEPVVDRLCVRLRTAGGDAWSSEVPATRYFSEAAQDASARLVASGTLAAGDRLFYRTVAFARSQLASRSLPLRFDTADRPPALVVNDTLMATFVANGVRRGEAQSGDVEVFVPQRVIDEAATLTAEAQGRETGGVLIGHLHRDPVGRDIFVEVTAQIAARYTVGDAVKLTFTAETWTDVRAALAVRRRGELMLGWFHSHSPRVWCRECPPERQRVCRLATGFLSAEDRSLHRVMFPRAFTLALVMTDSITGIHPALFGWRSGVLGPRGFHVVGADERAPASPPLAAASEAPCPTRAQHANAPEVTVAGHPA